MEVDAGTPDIVIGERSRDFLVDVVGLDMESDRALWDIAHLPILSQRNVTEKTKKVRDDEFRKFAFSSLACSHLLLNFLAGVSCS